MNLHTGMISLEGIDGAGKSTHLQFIQRFLEEKGQAVCVTREPGGTPLAERLREQLLHQEMDGLTEAFLVFAGRRNHIEQKIRPALQQGQWVLSDRFADASFAYQGGGRGVEWATLQTLERWTLGDWCGPNLTLWFDVPAPVAAQRRAAAREADRLEAMDLDFFERVRSAYERRWHESSGRMVRIDASGSIKQVATEVEMALSKFWLNYGN